MFDLEQKIAHWRRDMIAGGVSDPAVLDELESHLRDHVEQQVRSECDAGQAFQAGVLRIGQPGVLKREFSRADGILGAGQVRAVVGDRRKFQWIAFGCAMVVAVGYFAWKARVTPVYVSAATVQLLRPSGLGSVALPRGSVPENDVRSAEILNTSIRLLSSQRLRAKVAASLTPAERNLLHRPAVLRRAPDQFAPSADGGLGTLAVWPVRLSFLRLIIKVMHEDADAAALIANRYALLLGAELANNPALAGISARQLDIAMPRRDPVSPNFNNILVGSLGLVVITFVALVAVAALLRRLLRMSPPSGPQLKAE